MIPSHPPRNTRYRQQGGVVAALATGVLVVLVGVQCGQLWLLLAGGVFIGLICAGAVLGVATLREMAHAGSSLVGPVLKLDLVRTSRRGRTFLFRTAYAFALLVVLYLLYRQWFGPEAGSPWDLSARPRISLKETAQFAESFFHAFLLAQLGAVFVFTPAYVAGTIAEEKDRRTLEFLFVSDLTNREIVYSKLAARLLHLVLLLLTGLPVLMLATFFGGIAPEQVIAGFVSNGMTMLSLAGTSLVCSVYAERTLTALLSAYLVAAGHFVLCGMCCIGLPRGPGFYAPLELALWGAPVGGVLVSVAYYGLMTALCCRWAALRLRAWHRLRIMSTAATASLDQRAAETRRKRPPVHDDALLWKERYCTPALGLSASVRAGLAPVLSSTALVGLLFLFFAVAMLYLHHGGFGGTAETRRAASQVIGGIGVVILCVMVVAAGVRAAYSFGHERDHRTLENLLALPVENRDILAAKWRASARSVRGGFWLLGIVWLPAFFSWGPQWLGLPLHVLVGAVYVAFATSLGLWCSLVCRTTLRAVMWTLVVLFVLGVTVWNVLPRLTALVSAGAWTVPESLDSIVLCYTLPAYLGMLGGHVALAWGLWAFTNVRFGAVTGRMPVRPGGSASRR